MHRYKKASLSAGVETERPKSQVNPISLGERISLPAVEYLLTQIGHD